jgi:glycine betaine/proline transport system substrate-binding protein
MNQPLVKKIAELGASAVLACSMGSALAVGQITSELGDVGDPIIIPTHDWSSQIVMSNIVGQLLEKIGYEVMYTPTDSQAVYESIRKGEVHIEVEIWEESFAASFNTAMDKGGILDAGAHDAVTREDWWYPSYVAELCPGLPDWKALDNCYALFTKPDTEPNGQYLDGPVEWKNDTSRIEALGMRFTTINARGDATLWVELESAAEDNLPIVLYNWSPNFTDALYGGSFVEFPAYDPACKTDASWGVNPNMVNDCGSPAGGYLGKAAWSGMPGKWPAAYTVLTRISFTNLQVGTMAKLVDIDGMKHEEAATKWIEENEDIWFRWLHALQ